MGNEAAKPSMVLQKDRETESADHWEKKCFCQEGGTHAKPNKNCIFEARVKHLNRSTFLQQKIFLGLILATPELKGRCLI